MTKPEWIITLYEPGGPSIQRVEEAWVRGTLKQAKSRAIQRFGQGWTGRSILIETPDRKRVAERPIGGKWRDYA